MRATIVLTVTILMLSCLYGTSTAQDEQEVNYVDYGGVLLPVPGSVPDSPRTIAPGATTEGSQSTESGTVRGRSGGRLETTESGDEIQVFQSTRVSGITESSARDRFSWFYEAIELYTGIIPNLQDSLPHIANYQQAGLESRRPNQVTWIGFQPLDSYTRVFLQCSRPPDYRIEETQDGHLLQLSLDHTRLSLSNFSRFMDTSYFERSVAMIDAEQLGGQRVRVVIWRDELAPYAVTMDGNYLYIDFHDARH